MYSDFLLKLDADYSNFIQQIEDIHQQSVEMETVAKSLDEYSKYLGKKKKKNEKTD